MQAGGVKDIAEWDKLEALSMACPALPLCGLAIGEAERTLPEINARIRAVMDKVGLPKEEKFVVRATGELISLKGVVVGCGGWGCVRERVCGPRHRRVSLCKPLFLLSFLLAVRQGGAAGRQAGQQAAAAAWVGVCSTAHPADLSTHQFNFRSPYVNTGRLPQRLRAALHG